MTSGERTHEVQPNKLRFGVNRRLYPFESKFLSMSDGSRVHYVDEGRDPTLLFLHGNPTWSFLYRKIIIRLRDSFRCIALEYPGFGLSIAAGGYRYTPQEHSQVVEEFVCKLDLTDITLMAQDWGGPIGLACAVRSPDRVSCLVIGNTWAWSVGPRHIVFSRVRGGLVGRSIARCCNGIVRLFMTVGVSSELSVDEFGMYDVPFLEPASRVPTHSFPRQIELSRPWLGNLERDLSVLSDRPTLLVWGQKDPAFGNRERKRFERAFRDYRTVLLESAGHYVQEDSPEDISTAIRSFIS